MSRFSHWIREAHRRSIFQVLSVYLVGSWGALQVVEGITENAGLPDWVPPFALVLLILGLPVVLATAVVQEGLPGGESPEPSRDQRSTERNLSSGTGSLDLPSSRGSFLERNLTWKRAVFGGAGAFSVLGLAVGSYFVMRSTGIGPVASLVAQGVLDERDPVVLAEFANRTSDEALGQLVTEALRVDLLSSPVITVVEPAYVGQVLTRMERDPTDPITASVAREVAIREGFKAVIEGEVGGVGSGYLLNARIVSADDGAILAAFRRSAADEAGLLKAIDGLSQDIREKSGESLRSIKAGEALGTVTTSSLDALRLYSRAVRTAEVGDRERAVEIMEEALTADSTFAMAWRKLAALKGNIGRPVEEIDSAAARAYRLRDRLTDRERYNTVAYYHQQVTKDLDESERAYRSVLELFPDDVTALNNLALIHSDRDQHEAALALLERAVTGPGESSLAHANRVQALGALERFDEAVAAADRYEERYPDDPRVALERSELLFRAGRRDELRSALAAALERPLPTILERLHVHRLALTDLAEGRLDDAELRLREMVERDTTQVSHAIMDLAQIDGVLRRDPDRALAWLDRARTEEPFRQWAPESWTPVQTTWLPAFAGAPERMDPTPDELAANPPEGTSEQELRNGITHVRALVAAQTGDPARAVELYRERRRMGDCGSCFLAEMGLAMAQAGQDDEAVEALEAWLASDDIGLDRVLFDPAARETLAGILEARGDTAAALEHWRAFADAWADADAELQPRVQHARERIAALGG